MNLNDLHFRSFPLPTNTYRSLSYSYFLLLPLAPPPSLLLPLSSSTSFPLTPFSSSFPFSFSSTQSSRSRFLEEFLNEFAACLAEVTYAEASTLEATLGCHALLNSFVKHYFVMVGSLSYSERGMRFLDKMGIFQVPRLFFPFPYFLFCAFSSP